MNKKMLLIPFVAILAFALVAVASAGELSRYTFQTEFNGLNIYQGNSYSISTFAGEEVPVKVIFYATKNADDVKVKAWIEGFKDDVEDSSERFNIVKDTLYTKTLSLTIPENLGETDELYSLHVSISNGDNYDTLEYELRIQRESYDIEVLSVDYNTKVSAGKIVPISVVVKNAGFSRADDTYVVASIPVLGISSRNYVGDLISVESYEDYEDEEDSMQKTVYLEIPESTEAGVYDLEVKVYNSDSQTIVKKLISVESSNVVSIFAPVKSQDIKIGDSSIYELVVVNNADVVKVFNVNTVSGTALAVSVPSVITVGAHSSETVSFTVAASDDAEVGTYTFSVNVGNNQVTYGANVTEGSVVTTPIVALTVVLVIIFVVLLVVLFVLITRKDNKTVEEVETSYY